MLSKKRRIPREFFSKILSDGRRYNSEHLLLYCSLTQGISRFSFSISKKVYKGAVGRNKMRRRGYAIIGRYLERIKPGYLFFFSFKKKSDLIKFDVLEKEIIHLLHEATVIS